ncbi:mapk-regulated corepressor-interacting protein 1 isoform X4 [Camelus bactrianus]|uniref:Mapk-regulated corepressor-interacting protein 1 isoform X4 n=1 Tax=Camelus bactrianus TaxID=9837 RepID=A0AC58NQP4_CAMBA|nr:mapk-regulated corepressor-interacting protein 1 isoform X3 [Camelus dromedarius]
MRRMCASSTKGGGPRGRQTGGPGAVPEAAWLECVSTSWQGVERDLRSQMSGSERGLVEEYVEKVPNPSLKTFKPIDLSDLKRRNTQDAKKS